MALTTRIPLPPRADMNSGLSYLHPRTAEDILGFPSDGDLTDSCGDPSADLDIATEDVGPFRATGHSLAIASLKRIFSKVNAERPDLYDALGTAGMLCVRRIRGTRQTPSNHTGV
jgi:hypothetical protein